jgi:SPP1 family predicted phage head-tail adaptor
MRAGRIRYRVSIQKPVVLKNDSGEVIVDRWVEVARVWVAVEPISGSEYMTASQFRASITRRLRMRWRPDIDSSMRVVADDGVIYSIDTVMPTRGLTRELQLMCSSGVITDGGQP